MQPRLTRSNTDVMLTGVCGGMGEYFNIDPVIVRLIFVLVTLTSGIGIPIYLLLWILMPKSSTTAQTSQQTFQQGAQQFGEEVARLGQQIGQEASQLGREAHEVLIGQRQQTAQRRSMQPGVMEQQPPPPNAYRFDPMTGQPIQPNQPAIGETVNLNIDPAQLPEQYTPPADMPLPPYGAPPRRARNWRMLGLILIGIGGLIFLEQIGFNLSLTFPILLILAGVILLRRRR
ncbi:MAG: PspC domain-containing protein [Chloroflexales bacterium]|nr:PspC domain-containing protein [Chloroflexales bacterium]